MTSIDMSVPGVREHLALISAESRLALEVKTGMGFRSSTLQAARRWGFTHKGTKRGALLDCIALRRVSNPDYEPSDVIASAFETEADKKKLAAALRKADRIRKQADALPEGEQFDWRGV